MGYRKIKDLFADQTVLMFKELYSLEKIHGTSSNIRWDPETQQISLFSGGAKHESFEKLFNLQLLKESAVALLSTECPTTFYGEAYGGKMQGMRDTYGDSLRFICFEVKVGKYCLSVPESEALAKQFGFEFVDYHIIPATLEAIDAERDRPSELAKRRGIEEDKQREGVILRPLIELRTNNNKPVIAKHKGESFRERKSIPKVLSPEELEVLSGAQAIADEWVVPERLRHVLDSLGCGLEIEKTGEVIKATVADVVEESAGLVEMTKEARKAIGAKAAKVFKKLITQKLQE